MAKYEYTHRTVFCRDQEAVDQVINDEVYKLNAPEDVISLNITPYVNPDKTDGLLVPICFYVSYVYRWEVNEDDSSDPYEN